MKKAGFSGGDRTSILLPEVQTQLLKNLKATGKPVVFVLMTGSAIATPWESENIPAIVNAWYGGQDAGTALADVLFGDYNPAGRLPVTFYKSDSDLGSFEDYSMNNRTYRYFTGTPLYGFGFGLSYTQFEYSALEVPAQIVPGKNFIKAGQSKEIKFELTPADLSVVDDSGNSSEMKGKLRVSVGGSQPDTRTQLTKKTVTKTVSII